MKVGFEHWNTTSELQLGNWFFSIYLHPSFWGFDWHRNAPCCKFWVVIGPFEINRVWNDSDEYPYGEDDGC